jgi:hypothetical protein
LYSHFLCHIGNISLVITHSKLRASNRSKTHLLFFLSSLFAIAFPIYYLLFILQLYVHGECSRWPTDLMTTLCVPAPMVYFCPNGILLERAFEGLPSIHLGKPNLTNLHHLHHGLTGQRGRHCSKLLLTRVGPKKTPTSFYLITFSHNSSNFYFFLGSLPILGPLKMHLSQ